MWMLLWLAIGIRSTMDLSFKAAVHHLEFSDVSSVLPNIRKLVRNPFFWLAILVGATSMSLWMVVLSQFDLSFAYPLFSVCYVIIILMGRLLFHEHLDRSKMIGIGIIAFSSVLLAVCP